MNTFQDIFDAQKALFATGVTRTYEWRVEQLDRMARMIKENEGRFQKAMAKDFKTASQEYIFETAASAGESEVQKSQLREWMKPVEAPVPRFLAETGHKGMIYRERRADQQEQGSVERADDQRHAIRLAVDHSLVASFGQEARHRRFDWLHPLLQLAFLDFRLAGRRRGLEDVFLRGGLEVLSHRLLKALLMLPDHAGHPVELSDAPFVGARDPCGEQRLLGVEDILEGVHGVLA